MDHQAFKKELLKEASDRTARSTKTASGDISFTKLLTAEADYRVRNIKKASLDKEAMALNMTKELKNSRANTIWDIPDKSARIQKIEQELEAGFAPYFRPLLRAVPELKGKISRGENIDLSPYFSNQRPLSISEEGDGSTLRMEFEFQRHVIPVSGEFAEAAQKNIDMLEAIAPGFADFVEAINEHKVPMVPGFGSSQKGRPDRHQLKKFITAEAARMGKIRTAGGSIPLDRYWKDHMKRIQQNRDDELPKMTYQRSNDRLFSPDFALKILYPSYLLRAIQTRIFQGFRLDESKLDDIISSDVDKAIRQSNSSPRSRNRGRKLRYNVYRNWVIQQKQKILNEYAKAVGEPTAEDKQMEVLKQRRQQWQKEQVKVHMSDWGINPQSGLNMRGLRTNVPVSGRQSKQLYCLDLNNKELQYLLYALSDHRENEMQRDKLGKNLRKPPEQGFVIPQFSITYSANGFDSDPNQATPGMLGPQMMVLPPLIRKPSHMRRDGEQAGITYNTDQGNLNRNVLVGTGSDNVAAFLADRRVGEFAVQALQILQEPAVGTGGRRRRGGGRAPGRNVQSLYDEAKGGQSTGAYEAWIKYIGTTNKCNRTSAETLQECILNNPETGQPRSQEELQQFLQTSLSSELAREEIARGAAHLLQTGGRTLRNFQEADRLIPLLEAASTDPNGFDKETARELATVMGSEPLINSLDPGIDDDRKRPLKNLLYKVLTTGGREAQSAESANVSDELYELLHKYGYAVAKMMDFLHAMMVRSCEERLIQKLNPEEAKKKLDEYADRMRAAGKEPDPADISVENPENTEIHHLSYGRTYSSTTGKNQKGSIVFGIKYAFNAPQFGQNDPVIKQVVDQARKSQRGHQHGLYAVPEGAGDPASGRQTWNPQRGSEMETIFQKNSIGSIRVVEDMTFWFGMKSSQGAEGMARTLRGGQRESTFDMKIPEVYSYQDALAALRTNYPSIEEDLDLVFSPVSVNVADLKRAADKAFAKVKEELIGMGLNLDIAITDRFNRVRIASTMQDLGAAAEVEEILNDTDEASENRHPAAEPAPAPAGYTHQYDTAAPGNLGVPPVGVVDVSDDAAPSVDDPSPTPTPTPTPTPPVSGQTPPQELPVEDETRDMPKPMEYVRKPRKSRSLVRNGPDPQTAKLRRASSDDVLVKLANKLDKQGQSEIANKLDALLAILREE